ncbi:MAG: thioredoxin family protein [Fimbriimonadaceae bacterium]|nr:thioredoxin family protein [Fimbriimonadaceae bacterium]
MRRCWSWLVLLTAAGAALAEGPVAWRAAVEPAAVRPGEVAVLVLRGTCEPPYHIYAVAKSDGGMVSTSFAPSAGLEPLGGLREPRPKEYFDEGFQVMALAHEGSVVLRQPFRVPPTAPPGTLKLGGELTFQACTETSCQRPATVPLAASVRVVAGAVRPELREPPAETPWAVTATMPPPASSSSGGAPSPNPAPGEGPTAADQARSQGLGQFLLVAFLAGFAALLTPCVFPMVPITVSFFTKQAGDNARKRVGLAASYGLGIVVMYTTFGLLLAATMGASGVQRIAASPVLNLGFAALFVFFALSLFGVFELQLPERWVNIANQKSGAGGYLGAGFMGLTLTLAAFTCTVQFVGGVLVWAANGEYLWPILGMLAFSTAFALPFFLLALFPQYLATLPRSGGWLETTKITLGWIEVAAAVKFVSNADLVWGWRILSRELVLGLWAMVGLLVTLYLAGWLPMGHGASHIGRGRRVTAGVFAALTLWLLWGLSGARLAQDLEALLPPADYGRNPRLVAHEAWIEDLDQAKAAARAAGRPLFLDFTGVTCTNCRWMEQNVFTRPEVAERLARLTLTRLYTDTGARQREYRELQERAYQTASLPFYAVVTADGQTLATFDGLTRDPAKFVAFLDQGLAGGGGGGR